MKSKLSIVGIMLLVFASCGGGKHDPSGEDEDPVISLELLSTGPYGASVQVKAADALSVSYAVAAARAAAPELSSSLATGTLRPVTLTLDLQDLEASSDYVLYACGVGESGARGEVKTLPFTTAEAAAELLYQWERERSTIPYLPDMTLIPGPSSHRNPLEWSKDRWRTHVSYTDEDGVEHWLFDSFLLIEGQQTGVYGSKGYTYVLTESDSPSAPKELWRQLLDFWFNGGTFQWQESWWGDGVSTFGRWYSGRMVSPAPYFSDGQLKALDDCIEEVASRLGAPPAKRYIIMGMPEPVYFDNYIAAIRNGGEGNTSYWGEADGRSLDFSKVSDRVRAYKWFIDETRAAFARKKYKNIELAGFYILPEVLSTTWRAQYKKYDEVLPAVAAYLHSCKEGLYWIPYNMAEGYKTWRSFGIDIAWMQPNYYWEEDGKNPMDRTFQEINTYGMGLELEFEYSMVEAVNGSVSADKYRQRFNSYLDWAKSSGVYGTRSIALYSGTDAMEQLAVSTLPGDREMYHKLCRFIIESPLKKK